MRATTDRETFICLTREKTASEVDADGVRLERVDGSEALRSRLRALPADAVLVGEDSADEWLADSEPFRREFPAVPVLVFSADRDAAFVERALETDGTDVVRSTLAGTPPSLIRTRLDGLTAGEGTSPPVAERYETILNTAADAIYLLNAEGDIVAVNNSATALTGFSREELVGSPGSRYVDEKTAERSAELVERQLEGGAEFGTFETEIRTKEGASVPCEVRVSVLTVDGEFAGTVGIIRDLSATRDRTVGITTDITERRRAQEQLEAERDMFAQGPTVVFRYRNEEGLPVEYVSENITDMLGYSPAEIRSDGPPTYREIIHDADRDRVVDRVEAESDAATERFSHDPYRLWTADGDLRWVKNTTKLVREDGEVTHYQGYLVDITERKEREQELQTERDLIESIYEASPVGIGVFDADGRVTRANERIVEIFGVDREVLLDAPLEATPVYLCDESGERVSFARLPVQRILRTGESVYGHEVTVVRPDGTEAWVAWNGEPIVDENGEVTRVVATVEDISERKRREKEVATQRDELVKLAHINRVIRDVHDALVGATSRDEVEQTVCECLTTSGQYAFGLFHRLAPDGSLEARARTAEAREHVDQGVPVESATMGGTTGAQALATGEAQAIQSLRTVEEKEPWQEAAVDGGVESLAAIPVVYDGCDYGVIGVYATEKGAFGERELDVLGELGGTVGHAIAALESRKREATLTRLYEATQDLLAAETATAVSDTVVETASEVLAPPGLGVFLFDDDRNALVPAAATDELRSYYGSETVFGPGKADSVAWRAYATGRSQHYPDIRDAERVANPDTDARRTLVLPLGEHGVFVVASPEPDRFGQRKRQLIGLLAATTEAALDRVTGQADIRKRDRQLAERSDRLGRFESMLGLLCAVARELRAAATPDELHDGVCERITDVDTHAFAWIGTVSPDGDRLVPESWAGDGSDYLDDVALGHGSDEPSVRTALGGESTVVDDVTDALQRSAWAPAAVDRGFQSVVSVPLRHGGTTRGVLTVYSTEPGRFEGDVETAVAELAQSVAYCSSVVEAHQALLAGQVTELELQIGETDTVLNAVAELADEQVAYREIRQTATGSTAVSFALSDPPVEAILGLESELVAVESISRDDRSDSHVFTATLSASTVTATLLGCGAVPREVTAAPGKTRATVHVSRTVDVRTMLGRIRDNYPDAELVSRRTVERGDDAGILRSVLDERLTDRQRGVLLTAYESGFFRSPRDTTGSELAELLGVSQPTVTHHLREAQRRLFTALFANEAESR